MATTAPTATTVAIETTHDGHPAARVAHLIMALVPHADGTARTLVASVDVPASYASIVASGGHGRLRRRRTPGECVAADFHAGGFRATDVAGFVAEVEAYALHHDQLAALARVDLSDDAPRSCEWGGVHRATRFAQGVLSLSTASHGGFALTGALNDRVDPRWRSEERHDRDMALAADPACADDRIAYYEEDQLWAIVAFTLPALFTDHERAAADRTLAMDFPETWSDLSGRPVPAGVASPARARAAHRAANPGRWFIGSASASRTDRSRVLVVSTLSGRDENGRSTGPERFHLVDADAYAARHAATPGLDAMVDETHDVEVDREERPIAVAEAA